jgi:hypothetical protein
MNANTKEWCTLLGGFEAGLGEGKKKKVLKVCDAMQQELWLDCCNSLGLLL